MIYGVPPFYSLDENNLKEMIANNDLKFPENINIPENLKDLIEKLLKKIGKRDWAKMVILMKSKIMNFLVDLILMIY